MLKGIPNVLSPDLLKVLMEMGHGDEIVLADGNFPAASVAQRLIRSDGNGVAELLDAILGLLPLDAFVDNPVTVMSVVPGDTYAPSIWDEYRRILKNYDDSFTDFGFMERHAFYERARRAYAVVATSERARYANIILKKGIVADC